MSLRASRASHTSPPAAPAADDARLRRVLSAGLAAQETDAAKRMRSDAADAVKKAGIAGANKASKLSADAAQELKEAVARSWAGAKKPKHWTMTSARELFSRFITNYKREIEAKGWENLKSASDAVRVIHVDSGANLHAVVKITKYNVAVTVQNSMDGYDNQMVVDGDTFGSAAQAFSFSQLTKTVDMVFVRAVKRFKDLYGV